jgi:cyclase
VASGGVGTVEHFIEGARAGATGLLAASVFHFGTFTVPQVKLAMAAAGLPMRLPLAVPGGACPVPRCERA